MLAVLAPLAQVQESAQAKGKPFEVACVNGPQGTVLSGAIKEMDELAEELQQLARLPSALAPAHKRQPPQDENQSFNPPTQHHQTFLSFCKPPSTSSFKMSSSPLSSAPSSQESDPFSPRPQPPARSRQQPALRPVFGPLPNQTQAVGLSRDQDRVKPLWRCLVADIQILSLDDSPTTRSRFNDTGPPR